MLLCGEMVIGMMIVVSMVIGMKLSVVCMSGGNVSCLLNRNNVEWIVYVMMVMLRINSV